MKASIAGAVAGLSLLWTGTALAQGLPLTKDVRGVVLIELADGKSAVTSDKMVLGEDMQGVGKLLRCGATIRRPRFPTIAPCPSSGGFRVYLTRFPAGQPVTPDAKDLTGADTRVAGEVSRMHTEMSS